MFVQEIEKHLVSKLIPFWKKMRDDKHGGYFGEMNNNLEMITKANKGTIYHARILWFFSNAYLLLKDEQLLDEAKHAYTFIVNQCLDQSYGGVYWDLKYTGQANDMTKHTYAQAFTIYALSSYYDASRDPKAKQMAKELFTLVEEKCVDEYGYLEAFNREFRPISNEKLSENGIEASKTMNTLLHIFEAYTELYRVNKEVEVKERLVYILNLIKNKVYNARLKRQEVFFTTTMETMIDLHSYGHDIEASWLIDRGLEILEDQHLRQEIYPLTKALRQKVYEKAFQDNSLLNECENGVDDTNRIWWVQAEAVVGFANGYEKSPDKKEYLHAAEKIWAYIQQNMIDERQTGEWFWQVDEKHQPDKEKPIVESWKAPYHNGRMCLEIIKRKNGLYGGNA